MPQTVKSSVASELLNGYEYALYGSLSISSPSA